MAAAATAGSTLTAGLEYQDQDRCRAGGRLRFLGAVGMSIGIQALGQGPLSARLLRPLATVLACLARPLWRGQLFRCMGRQDGRAPCGHEQARWCINAGT